MTCGDREPARPNIFGALESLCIDISRVIDRLIAHSTIGLATKNPMMDVTIDWEPGGADPFGHIGNTRIGSDGPSRSSPCDRITGEIPRKDDRLPRTL